MQEAVPDLQLAESLAHELQAPLAEASVHVDILRQDRLTSKQMASVERLRGAIGRARAVLDSVGAIRSMELGGALNRERTPMAEVVRSVQGMLADLGRQYFDRRIRLEFKQTSDGPSVAVDRNLLGVAVREVVKNAYQYSFAETAVIVETRIVKQHLRISCRNTGAAMDHHDVQLCTEPGWRSPKAAAAEPAGRGLGLWLAKRIVESHDGQMTVESSGGHTLVALVLLLGVDQ